MSMQTHIIAFYPFLQVNKPVELGEIVLVSFNQIKKSLNPKVREGLEELKLCYGLNYHLEPIGDLTLIMTKDRWKRGEFWTLEEGNEVPRVLIEKAHTALFASICAGRLDGRFNSRLTSFRTQHHLLEIIRLDITDEGELSLGKSEFDLFGGVCYISIVNHHYFDDTYRVAHVNDIRVTLPPRQCILGQLISKPLVINDYLDRDLISRILTQGDKVDCAVRTLISSMEANTENEFGCKKPLDLLAAGFDSILQDCKLKNGNDYDSNNDAFAEVVGEKLARFLPHLSSPNKAKTLDSTIRRYGRYGKIKVGLDNLFEGIARRFYLYRNGQVHPKGLSSYHDGLGWLYTQLGQVMLLVCIYDQIGYSAEDRDDFLQAVLEHFWIINGEIVLLKPVEKDIQFETNPVPPDLHDPQMASEEFIKLKKNSQGQYLARLIVLPLDQDGQLLLEDIANGKCKVEEIISASFGCLTNQDLGKNLTVQQEKSCQYSDHHQYCFGNAVLAYKDCAILRSIGRKTRQTFFQHEG